MSQAVIGFEGETSRWKAKPRGDDFATERELTELKMFGDQNTKNKMGYRDGVITPWR